MTRRWLVAVDFSALAQAALRYAASELAERGGTLALVHAHQPITAAFSMEMASIASTFEDVDKRITTEAEARLEVLAEGVRADHPGLSVEVHVEVGNPPDAILEVAQRVDAGLIVVGSHGRRGLERLLLGSVAERLIRLSDKPVLVFKSAETPAKDEP